MCNDDYKDDFMHKLVVDFDRLWYRYRNDSNNKQLYQILLNAMDTVRGKFLGLVSDLKDDFLRFTT